MKEFQQRVVNWLRVCYVGIRQAPKTRAFRFTEESLELTQACGISKDEVLELVDYVYSRPVGTIEKEAGAVILTLSAVCSNYGIDMHEVAYNEIDRMSNPESIERTRNKNLKVVEGSPLPGNVDQ